jgi:hypothetical protein
VASVIDGYGGAGEVFISVRLAASGVESKEMAGSD